MKKLILLAIAAAGVGVLVKNKSEQLKAGANKVTHDPRVQSALATASEKAAPIKEKAAPYAEAAKAKAGPYAATVKEKAGPYAATVKEKAGPYAEQAKEKVSAAAGVASEKLHLNGSSPESTPEAASEPAAPGSTTGSSSSSEYGGYPPAPPAPSALQAGVTGDPLTDPIAPADPYAAEVPPPPPADPDKASYDDLGGGDTAVKPTSEGTPEFAPEPVDSPEEEKDKWFRG